MKLFSNDSLGSIASSPKVIAVETINESKTFLEPMNKTKNHTKILKKTFSIKAAKAAGGVGRAIPAYILNVSVIAAKN